MKATQGKEQRRPVKDQGKGSVVTMDGRGGEGNAFGCPAAPARPKERTKGKEKVREEDKVQEKNKGRTDGNYFLTLFPLVERGYA